MKILLFWPAKIYCSSCREELGLKLSVIQLHVKSKKHMAGKERLVSKTASEKDITESLIRYNHQEHLSGENLPEEIQIYRIKIVTTFLKAGVPLNKINIFRDLLEENGQQLAGRRSLSDLIPFIHQNEVSKLARREKNQCNF